MASSSKELVKETRWMRVYSIGDSHVLYESKFLADRLQVSPAALKSDWQSMSEEERVEFALAFSAKPDLRSSDEEILDYLMEVGSKKVLGNIALLVVKHSDKERAFRFLTQQVEREQKPLVNYYQALELLKDRRAVPILSRAYERYKAKLAAPESEGSDLVDYLRCCKALLAMEGSSEYKRAISEMRSHSSEHISRMASRLLEGTT